MQSFPKFFLLIVCSLITFLAKANRALYVDDFAAILNSPTLQTNLLQYAEANEFDYLILYELHLVQNEHDLTNENTNQILADFISDAKNNYGITKVAGAVENAWFCENRLMAYNSSRTAADEKFDVINIEFEFWNTPLVESGGYYCSTYLQGNGYTCDVSGAYAFCKNELLTVKNLVDNSTHPMSLEIYVGWPDAGQLLELADLTDRILLHAYVADPNTAFSYAQDRLEFFENYSGTADLMIIYSAEPEFSGAWLQSNNMQSAEAAFLADYTASTGTWKSHVNLQDFVYFAYTFMNDIVLPVSEIEEQTENEEPDSQSFALYPNPANHTIHVQTDFYLQSYQIYNAQGSILIQGERLPASFSLVNYPQGLYFLQTRKKVYKFFKK